MRKYILTVVITLIAFAGASQAQEVFVGGQFTRINPAVKQINFKFDRNSDSLGGVAALTTYLKGGFGATAEGSAVFNTNGQSNQLYTALGGLAYKYKKNASIQPFIKGQLGVAFERTKGDPLPTVQLIKTDAGFASKVSAGVDVGKGSKYKFRVVELGYLTTNLYGQTRGNFVASTGVIF